MVYHDRGSDCLLKRSVSSNLSLRRDVQLTLLTRKLEWSSQSHNQGRIRDWTATSLRDLRIHWMPCESLKKITMDSMSLGIQAVFTYDFTSS